MRILVTGGAGYIGSVVTEQLIAAGEIKGKSGELTLVHSLGKIPAKRVIVAGLGKQAQFNVDSIRRVSAEACRFARGKVAKRVAGTKRFDAVVCLGAVIRGATPHFDFVAAEASKGIAQVMMETGLPVIFGVITVDTIEQAIERAGTKLDNKGFSAGMAAVEMANLFDAV